MEMLIEVLILATVFVVFHFVCKNDPSTNKVKYPKWYLCIGILSLSFWLFFIILMLINNILMSIDDEPIYNLIFYSFVLVGMILMSVIIIVSYFNIYTTYDDVSFTHSNFWRRKRTIYYSDIKAIYRKKHAKYLVVFESDDGRITVDSKYTIGYGEFIEKVNKNRYRR